VQPDVRTLPLTSVIVMWGLLPRLFCAALAGGIIGWNRHRAGKPAGIGTHALVALGSGLFVAIPAGYGSDHVDALSRTIQGVAAGIGFLGAGEIFRDSGSAGRITGLTSAAALWVTAALGIAIVGGPVVQSLVVAILVVVILELAPRIEKRFPGKRPSDPADDEKDRPRARL
jgi:putative Mg2+ transporter-C (MgtC) family protein